ncbi:MFS transporter [Tersicoccus sp. Bi-70]|uniref:MFS transporter n=1 Tax=Tersicoccus sp. Bi-70 TaxID=1897634 RepID=UPI000977B54B|nr:MFS transporter [Tersicoccus sp. Bi-70]OMH36598.1 MFS transporter [Tersicoccus sp. Bi-70]
MSPPSARTWTTPLQRRVLVVAILASFIAILDGSVVNLALPAIAGDLGGGLGAQQWIVDGYLLTLGAFMLLAGSVSDVIGRGRILQIGLWGFGVTSLLCALAPDPTFLVVMRALQGVCGAMLVPSALALITSHFDGADQAAAIGTWTGSTGAATIVAPLIGGLGVDLIGWRIIFLVNLLPVAACLMLLPVLLRADREDQRPDTRIDLAGGLLTVLGLGGLVFALIEAGRLSAIHPTVLASAAIGVLSLVALVVHERRTPAPMIPAALLKVRNVAWGNAATFVIYGALGLSILVLSLYLQQVVHLGATQAGMATLPVTVLMILFSARVGRLAGRWGPRWFMTVGPLVAAAGHLLMLRVGPDLDYVTDLLPGVVLFGVGLTITVSPLTSTILGAVPATVAGVGSAINNAIARIAGLVTTASAGLLLGTGLDTDGLHRVLLTCALLLAVGGVISAVGIRRPDVDAAARRIDGDAPGTAGIMDR